MQGVGQVEARSSQARSGSGTSARREGSDGNGCGDGWDGGLVRKVNYQGFMRDSGAMHMRWCVCACKAPRQGGTFRDAGRRRAMRARRFHPAAGCRRIGFRSVAR